MNIDDIFNDLRGFTKKERDWLKNELKPGMKTVRGVAGRNVSITDSESSQIISANDCDPCPP